MTATILKRWSLRAMHWAGCAGFLLVCVAIGGTFGALTVEWQKFEQWPYTVVKRELATPEVEPGGDLRMKRLIDYHEEDCDLLYERRVRSRVPDENGAFRNFVPPDQDYQHLPIDLSGQWQSWSVKLPENFPCGAAALYETVSTACNEWQRKIRRLRKPDIITPFTVACPPA